MTETLAVAGLVITVLLAYAQMQRQHRASLRLQDEHLKNDLRLRVYDDLATQLQNAARALGRAKISYMLLPGKLHEQAAGRPVNLDTSAALTAKHFRAVRRVNMLILHFEKYEIAFERFETIRSGISNELKRLMDAHFKLSSGVIGFLPVQGQEIQIASQSVSPLRPTSADVESIESLVSEYLDVVSNLEGFTLDAMVESQNALLGNLFGRELPGRNPEDPTVPVLKRDGDNRVTRPKGRWV